MGIPREHNTSKRSAVFLPADCLTVGMPVQGMFDLSVKRIFIFFFWYYTETNRGDWDSYRDQGGSESQNSEIPERSRESYV